MIFTKLHDDALRIGDLVREPRVDARATRLLESIAQHIREAAEAYERETAARMAPGGSDPASAPPAQLCGELAEIHGHGRRREKLAVTIIIPAAEKHRAAELLFERVTITRAAP